MRGQPWESISITDIARQANRSVGAFYQRLFGSKEHFLSVLLHRWLENSYARIQCWNAAKSAPGR